MALQTNEKCTAGPKEEGEVQTSCDQTKTSSRDLTREELDRLSSERTLVSEFKQMKLEKEAKKNWDLFYKRNTTNFFKDRHWTTREFEELRACREVSKPEDYSTKCKLMKSVEKV